MLLLPASEEIPPTFVSAGEEEDDQLQGDASAMVISAVSLDRSIAHLPQDSQVSGDVDLRCGYGLVIMHTLQTIAVWERLR
jgi:hypothetical protein